MENQCRITPTYISVVGKIACFWGILQLSQKKKKQNLIIPKLCINLNNFLFSRQCSRITAYYPVIPCGYCAFSVQ